MTRVTWFGMPAARVGDRLVQKDLAKTLRLIAEQGPDAFYKGRIAEQIAHLIQYTGFGNVRAENGTRHSHRDDQNRCD